MGLSFQAEITRHRHNSIGDFLTLHAVGVGRAANDVAVCIVSVYIVRDSFVRRRTARLNKMRCSVGIHSVGVDSLLHRAHITVLRQQTVCKNAGVIHPHLLSANISVRGIPVIQEWSVLIIDCLIGSVIRIMYEFLERTVWPIGTGITVPLTILQIIVHFRITGVCVSVCFRFDCIANISGRTGHTPLGIVDIYPVIRPVIGIVIIAVVLIVYHISVVIVGIALCV